MSLFFRIFSILFDLSLAYLLFHRPSVQDKQQRNSLLILFILLLVHLTAVLLFSENQFFLICNLIISILEYSLIGSCFQYTFRTSLFWILFQTSLTLLAGAVLNQASQLFLPLETISESPLPFIFYLLMNFSSSAIITVIIRKLLQNHQQLIFSDSSEKWFHQLIIPTLLIFFTFTISAIQGNVFNQRYLSFFSLLSLLVFTFSSIYFILHLSEQQQQFFQNKLEKEQLLFQLRESQQSQKEYQRLQSLRHDLKNKHLTLLSLLESQPSKAKAYLLQLTDTIENSETFYSKNLTINFLLNQKLSHLQESIMTHVECFVPQKLSIPPDILAVILGNCLDNSIAACNRLPQAQERNLSLNIRYFQNHLFISISNSFDQQETETRKHRQQDGWGLRNIEALVHEYQGSIKRWITENQFHTEIVLQLKTIR